MSVLNARVYRRAIEREINRANRRSAGQIPSGAKVNKHPKAERFEFPKHAQRFDPNAGNRGGEAQVA